MPKQGARQENRNKSRLLLIHWPLISEKVLFLRLLFFHLILSLRSLFVFIVFPLTIVRQIRGYFGVYHAQTDRKSNESAIVLISVDSSTLETDPVDFCLPQSPAHERTSRLQIPTATEAENAREVAVSLQQLQWITQWFVHATSQ
jgi:hypothetical protein